MSEEISVAAEIQAKLIKLRSLVPAHSKYQWWYEEQWPLLDEMVEEGWLERHILFYGKDKQPFYAATETGEAQYHHWVVSLEQIGVLK